MPINYVIGDATYPHGDGPKVIAHCVNDIGKWGSGFVLALDKRWPVVGEQYQAWSKAPVSITPFKLGEVQFVQVESDIVVANIVGQHQTIRENPKPIQYHALARGLKTVALECLANGASFHAPKLGSGLARGSWPVIEMIIEEEIVKRGVSATVYALE